jgi:hypothetical protein
MKRKSPKANKTLFLDFDGVLHPVSAGVGAYFAHVERLAEVLTTAECEIVVSSSWRFHFDLESILDKMPDAIARRIVGVTGDPCVNAYARYSEILEYLKLNPSADWRALDDSVFEFPEKCPELILCNPSTGLDHGVLAKLTQWLQT